MNWNHSLGSKMGGFQQEEGERLILTDLKLDIPRDSFFFFHLFLLVGG